MGAFEQASRGRDAVAGAFENQVAYCQANGAPITARVVAALGAIVAGQQASEFLDKIRGWAGTPLADALPLRAAAGVHARFLSGEAPELRPLFTGEEVDPDRIERTVARTIAGHDGSLLPWLDGPPQTNEAGRSASFIAAMLWLTSRGCPSRFACLEIGASAGINLMLARYRYDLGSVVVGPDQPKMHFTPEWRGPSPPPGPITILSAEGCDIAPVDLRDPVQALRLKAYIWADQPERFARLERAIEAARERPPVLVQMAAADFVERALAQPQAAGTTRVLQHSIVWQYLPADEQARITSAMERAGAEAHADLPLAWISLEADRTMARHNLSVRTWPGGETHQLGHAHAHGTWLEWSPPA